MSNRKNVAVFASGSGSNAEEIFKRFQDDDTADVVLLLSNNKNAKVLERAAKYGVPTFVFDRNTFYHTDEVLDALKNKKVDLIVLAGFMWLVPGAMVKAFPSQIINIHPALLPKYGGKGMYGMHVHRAVKAAGEVESGITIHYVNERYDEGAVIFQAKCALSPEDTPEEIAKKVQKLEHLHYPQVVQDLTRK